MKVTSQIFSATFEMHDALTIEAAITAADRRVFDLVLLDLHMPGVTGLDALKLLKSKLASAAVVIMIQVEIAEGSHDGLTEPTHDLALPCRWLINGARKWEAAQGAVPLVAENLANLAGVTRGADNCARKSPPTSAHGPSHGRPYARDEPSAVLVRWMEIRIQVRLITDASYGLRPAA
jgi:CheY-like chemotaxis protein